MQAMGLREGVLRLSVWAKPSRVRHVGGRPKKLRSGAKSHLSNRILAHGIQAAQDFRKLRDQQAQVRNCGFVYALCPGSRKMDRLGHNVLGPATGCVAMGALTEVLCTSVQVDV